METAASLRLSAELKNLAVIRRFVQETATALNVDQDALYDLIQAVDESAANVIVHGYQGRPGDIEVEVKPAGDTLVVCLRDQAPVFDPTRLPPPDLTLPLDQRPPGGLGVYLTRQLLDEVTHRVTSQGGNELTLVKKAILSRHPKEDTQ